MSDAFVAAAPAESVKEGAMLSLNINDTAIALTRLSGVVRAFGDICTHDDGPLADGEIAAGCVVCPRHGARFDLVTGKATFPAVARIPIYAAEERDGMIWVMIGE